MKKLSKALALCLLSLLILMAHVSLVFASGDDDKTLSPYFFVNSPDPSVDQLPLKSTSAEVNIAGVIADVEISQVYKNEGKHALEAIYVFPASSRAAVYAMKMTIGDRTIYAEIRERNQARKDYEQAKKEGKRTSLLEQQRPNVFQMNVANIMPGDEIKVILKYTELLIPEDGVYEFVYPAVVGPRYTEQSAENAPTTETFTNTPYQKAGETALFDFNLNAFLQAGMPIQEISSSTHKIKVDYDQLSSAAIQLNDSEENPGNRDFILNYQLAGKKIESGLLLYEHEDENFFLMMMQPPERVSPEDIPAREYIFIVDVSGSMRGFPLDISKKLLRDLIVNLRPTDKFNVLLFASSSSVLSENSLLASPENVNAAVNFIDNKRGGGGTRLLPAMERALQLPRAEGLSRSVVVVTDGYVSVERQTYDLIRNHLNEANLFAFGIGSSVNRHLIEGMAHVGLGEPMIITRGEDASGKAEQFRKYINSPVLTQIKTKFDGFDVYDVEPPSIPDVLAERPVIIFGKYKGDPIGTIKLEGYSGKKKHKVNFEVDKVRPGKRNGALRYLWARKKIELLDDYSTFGVTPEHQKEVTDLGLKYNLMTAYTSFIAIDQLPARAANKPVKTVKQPLPMPQGVTNSAVGFDLAIEGVVRKELKPKVAVTKVRFRAGKISANISDQSGEALQRAVKTRMRTLILCEALQKLPEGTFLIKISLDNNGNVIAVELPGVKLSPALQKCLTEVIQKWQFAGLNLNQPFSFEVPVTVSH